MSPKRENADTFEKAAKLWEEMRLPDFQVEGYMDGQSKMWDVPGVLRVAAERLRDGEREAAGQV